MIVRKVSLSIGGGETCRQVSQSSMKKAGQQGRCCHAANMSRKMKTEDELATCHRNRLARKLTRGSRKTEQRLDFCKHRQHSQGNNTIPKNRGGSWGGWVNSNRSQWHTLTPPLQSFQQLTIDITYFRVEKIYTKVTLLLHMNRNYDHKTMMNKCERREDNRKFDSG